MEPSSSESVKMISEEGSVEFRNVSFDIFDTLLIRPYARPDDLFTHIEMNEKRKGFAKERISAERRARRKICHEITFDEIYLEISPEYQDLKDIELEYEMQVMQPNAGIVEMFNDLVKNSDRVVLTSDMYLSKDFIMKLLDKNNISGFSGLYLSNEYRESKKKGGLFRIVLSDLGISPDGLLHIGDNYVSDYKVPTSLGIECVLVEKHIDSHFRTNPRTKGFVRRCGAEGSILAGMDSLGSLMRDDFNNEDMEENWWYRFGYRYGGPISVMFAQFIHEHMKDGVVLFAARDGFVPMNVFRYLFGNEHDSEYVFAFRLFYIAFCEDVTKRYAHYVVNYFANDIDAKNVKHHDDAYDTYLQNKDLFDSLRKREMDSYRKYIQDLIKERNVYVADMTTMKYSSQKLIRYALSDDKDVIGLYYTAMADSKDCDHISFNDHKKSISNWSRTNMTEFLMSSPEHPAVGMDADGVIYSTDNPECEIYRSRVSKDILRGCMDYAEDMKNIFGTTIPRISHRTLSKWLDSGIVHLSEEDASYVHRIFWASGADHSTYRRAVLSSKDIPYYLKSKLSEFLFYLRRK